LFGSLLNKFMNFTLTQVATAVDGIANKNRMLSNITILNTTYCEVSPSLAKIIKPMLSYTKVSWVRGPISLRKLRLEEERSVMCRGNSGNYVFPTGLLPKVTLLLLNRNVSLKIIGEEKKFPYTSPSLNTVELREEQLRLVYNALNKQRGILIAPTGEGKTVIGIAIISAFLVNKDFKALWLCHTKDLLHQSAKVCENELGISPGIMGDSSCDTDRQITMATRQSFVKYAYDLAHLYDFILVDEAHHITSFDSQYGSLLTRITAPIRIGLTATLPTQNKEAMLAIEGLLGPVIGEVTTQEGVEKGTIADIKIRILKAPFLQRIKDLRKYQDVYYYGVVCGVERNRMIIEKAKEHVNKGDSVLILVTQITHGRNLFAECGAQDVYADFAEGATKSKERAELKDALNSKRIKCVIATTIWKEGINLPELNVVINAAGGKSEIATIQAIGRGLRRTTTKKEIIVYDCFDESHRYLTEHFNERMRIYEEMGWL